MLVTCAQCKSPVFVSAAAVAAGDAEVGCGSCGAELVVSGSGDTRLGGGPVAGAGQDATVAALPSYQGDALLGSSTPRSDAGGDAPAVLAPPAVASAPVSGDAVPPASVPAGARESATGALVGSAGPDAPGSSGGGERIPHFLSSVPPIGASEPALPRAEARMVLDAPRTGALASGASETSAAGRAPDAPLASTVVRRRPVQPPHGRPGEPVTIFPPSRPGAQAIAIGAPAARKPVAPLAPHRLSPRRPARRTSSRVGVLAVLGLATALVAAGAWWALGERGVLGAAAIPPSSGAPAVAPGATGAGASQTARDQAMARYRHANQLIARNETLEAVAELEACVSLAPDLGVAYRSLGIAYMRLGREKSAIEAYERFVRLEPRHRDADGARRIIEAYRGQGAAP